MRSPAVAAIVLALVAGLLPGPRPVQAATSSPTAWSDAAWAAWDGSGQVTSVPAVVPDAANQRLFVAVRGSDQAIWYRIYQGGAWGPWTGLGGISVAEPAAAGSGNGAISVFVRGGDDQLWADDLGAGGWSGWHALGGVLGSAPAVASAGPGRLDVFVRGSDRQLWQRSLDAGSWSSWGSVGGRLASGPAVASDAAGHLDVFVQGTDGQLWQRGWDGSAWSPWGSLAGGLASAPSVESPAAGQLDVFVRGTDAALWQRHWDGSQWSPWGGLGGTWTSAPAASSPASGVYDLVVRGTDAGLWHLSSDVQGWTSLGGIPAGNVIGGVVFHGQVYPLSCEAAALEMALTHQEIFTTQTALLNVFGIDWRSGYYSGGVVRWGDPNVDFVGSPNGSEFDLTGYGTYEPVVTRAAGTLGGELDYAGHGLRPSAVYADALENHPVMAWISANWRFNSSQPWLAFDGRWILYAGPAEHAVLVMGVSPSSVYVFNPAVGRQWVSKSAFEAAFSTYGDMAVVLD